MVELPQLPIKAILDSETAPWNEHAVEIGRSRQGRAIRAITTGSGALAISLIGGCHADEPVGPEMLERLASFLIALPADHALATGLRWHIVPHVNPDGRERNLAWARERLRATDYRGEADSCLELAAYLRRVVRELPGDDIEFGFPRPGEEDSPAVRPENRSVADFLRGAAPIALHGSFHGMGFAPGPWFLLEKSWIERTVDLRSHLAAKVAKMGYRLFDSQRHGEKGFHRIAPGFATRPDSVAMRRYFEDLGDKAEAAKFRPSSMETVRAHALASPRFDAGDPLTFVSEMPLFLTLSLGPGPIERQALTELHRRLVEAQAAGLDCLEETAAELGITAMPLRDQMRLQLELLDQAMLAVRAATDD